MLVGPDCHFYGRISKHTAGYPTGLAHSISGALSLGQDAAFLPALRGSPASSIFPGAPAPRPVPIIGTFILTICAMSHCLDKPTSIHLSWDVVNLCSAQSESPCMHKSLTPLTMRPQFPSLFYVDSNTAPWTSRSQALYAGRPSPCSLLDTSLVPLSQPGNWFCTA